MPSQAPNATSTTANSQCGLPVCSCMSWQVRRFFFIQSVCLFPPSLLPSMLCVCVLKTHTHDGHQRISTYCMHTVQVYATPLITLFSGHPNPFQSGTIDQRGYNIGDVPPLKYTYSVHSKHCQPLDRRLTDLAHDMLQMEPTDRPSLQECVKRVSLIVT